MQAKILVSTHNYTMYNTQYFQRFPKYQYEVMSHWISTTQLKANQALIIGTINRVEIAENSYNKIIHYTLISSIKDTRDDMLEYDRFVRKVPEHYYPRFISKHQGITSNLTQGTVAIRPPYDEQEVNPYKYVKAGNSIIAIVNMRLGMPMVVPNRCLIFYPKAHRKTFIRLLTHILGPETSKVSVLEV